MSAIRRALVAPTAEDFAAVQAAGVVYYHEQLAELRGLLAQIGVKLDFHSIEVDALAGLPGRARQIAAYSGDVALWIRHARTILGLALDGEVFPPRRRAPDHRPQPSYYARVTR